MMVSRPILITLGAGATAVVAIVSTVMLIIPLLRSDPPPFAGVERFQELAMTFTKAQSTQQQIADTLKRISEKQDQQDLDYWTGQQAIAEARLKIMPGDELAKGMLKVAKDQITQITVRIATNTGQPQR